MGHQHSSPKRRGPRSPPSSRKNPNTGDGYSGQPYQNFAFQPAPQANTKEFLVPNAISQNVSPLQSQRMETKKTLETFKVIKTEPLNEEDKVIEGDFHKVNAALRFAGNLFTLTTEENTTISIQGRPELGLNLQTFSQDQNGKIRRRDAELESHFIQVVQTFNESEKMLPFDQVVLMVNPHKTKFSHRKNEQYLDHDFSRRETEHSETRSTSTGGGRYELQKEKAAGRAFESPAGHSKIYQKERNARKTNFYQKNDHQKFFRGGETETGSSKVVELSRGKHSESYTQLHRFENFESQEKPRSNIPTLHDKKNSNNYFVFSKKLSEASQNTRGKGDSDNERKSSRTSLPQTENEFETKIALNSKTQDLKQNHETERDHKTKKIPQNKFLRQAEASSKTSLHREDQKENLKQTGKSRRKTPSKTDESDHSEKNHFQASQRRTPQIIHKKPENKKDKSSRDSSVEKYNGKLVSGNLNRKEPKLQNNETEDQAFKKSTANKSSKMGKQEFYSEKNQKKEKVVVPQNLKYPKSQSINLYELNESQIPIRSDIDADESSDDDLQPVQATLDLSNFMGSGKTGTKNHQILNKKTPQEDTTGAILKGKNVSEKSVQEMKRIPLMNSMVERKNDKSNPSRIETTEPNYSKSPLSTQIPKNHKNNITQLNNIEDEQQFLENLRNKFKKLDQKTDKMMSVNNSNSHRGEKQTSQSTTNSRKKSPIGNKAVGIQSEKAAGYGKVKR